MSIRGYIGEAIPTEALFSKNEKIRIFARLSISTAHDGMVEFINDERARGSDTNALLSALATWMVQVHAAAAVQLLSKDSGPDAATMFSAYVRDGYARHFDAVALHLEQATKEALS